jgi:phage terminase large subunit
MLELFKATDLYLANKTATEDIVVDQGGTSSGKTYSIMQCLFSHAYEDAGCIITIAGQDIPNLKVGALRDAHNIVDASPALQALIKSYNKSDRIYELHNGSILEFKSYDDWQDAKSGKRDYLFVNEANGFSVTVWQELYMRTRKKSYLDYNPNAEFWVHQNLIGKPHVKLIISDHRHNTFLDQKTHDKIEGIEDPELWKVYARGLTGKLEGIIFRNYNIVSQMPVDGRFIGYGLDFGFTNDPTCLVEVRLHNGELYVDELIYRTGMLNRDIDSEMAFIGVDKRREIVADSAEPKSIAELQRSGWHISGADKGPDSIKASIDTLKGYKLNVTQRSSNLRKELNSYKWEQNKDGVLLNKPVDFMNHAIDALRYVALNKLKKQQEGKYTFI